MFCLFDFFFFFMLRQRSPAKISSIEPGRGLRQGLKILRASSDSFMLRQRNTAKMSKYHLLNQCVCARELIILTCRYDIFIPSPLASHVVNLVYSAIGHLCGHRFLELRGRKDCLSQVCLLGGHLTVEYTDL